MNVAIYTGLIVVLLLSVLFLGPGLFSERTDYPIITWLRRQLRERRDRKSGAAAGAGASNAQAPSKTDPGSGSTSS